MDFIDLLEPVFGIFKPKHMTRTELEKRKIECRRRKEEAQLNLAREKSAWNANKGKIEKYEKEIIYWTRLLERLEDAESEE